jgi:hypothetical protein
VGGAAILAHAGAGGVLGDDVTDGTGGERLVGCACAFAEADEQRVGCRRRAGGMPPSQRVVCLGVQRNGAGAPAL